MKLKKKNERMSLEEILEIEFDYGEVDDEL